MTSLALERSRRPNLLRQLRDASPLLWQTSLVFLAAFVICAALTQVDPRLFNGVSTWVKPAKFFLSLAIHMLTLAFAITLLPHDTRRGNGVRMTAWVMVSMAVFEMIYITVQAARAEASHFNGSTQIAQWLYTAMGLGAAAMMVVTIWLGWQVLRHRGLPTLALATGWGLILTGVLTLIVGFTLGGMGSHWIGGDQTDATGLPVFGWSTTGGDLRAAHFAATHLAQALPLAAVALRSPRSVYAMAAVGVLITLALYVQALMGLPLVAL